MSDKKAVFFDADGTICDMEKGVPGSAVESIKKLVANGHQAWLCTGRSRAFVSRYLEEVPFTGIISACGATIEKDGKRLSSKTDGSFRVKRTVCVMVVFREPENYFLNVTSHAYTYLL